MGTLMKNGIPYGGGGGGDNSKTVTYEQYKNLSEAEKNSDTTYYVPDYPEETVEIVDSLDSTDTDKALSANMGRKLKENTVSYYTANITGTADSDIRSAVASVHFSLSSEEMSKFYVVQLVHSAGGRYTALVSGNGAAYFKFAVLTYYYEHISVHRYANGVWTGIKFTGTAF